MSKARAVLTSDPCIKCGKAYPVKEFIHPGGICIICVHQQAALEKAHELDRSNLRQTA